MRKLSCALALTVLLSQTSVVFANPTSLDFTSTGHTAPSPVTSGTVFINEGGRLRGVTPTSMITPAEYAAVSQVLATSRQSVDLSALGTAIGGRYVIPQSLQISNLVVPTNMQVIRDFASSAVMSLTGNLINSGSVYAVSTNAADALATIQASNIVNNKNGLLTSVLPPGGLSGFGNAISNLSLALVTNSLTNAGTISSAGDLNIGAANGSLNINNAGGTLSAVNNINVGAADSVFLRGGNVLGGSQVNFNVGKTVDVFADGISGVVNATACDAHVGVNGGNLVMGAVNASGDPLFFNVTGDVTVTSNTTGGAPLTYLAGQNITFQNFSAITLKTASAADNKGFPVTMIAGVKITPPNATFPLAAGKTLTVNGPSGLGGNIRFSNSANVTINTASSAPGVDGGSALFAAYPNTAGTVGGDVDLGLVDLNTSSQTGKAGDITIYAPGQIHMPGTSQSGFKPATLTATTTAPKGTLTVDSVGNVSGKLTPGTVSSGGQIFVDRVLRNPGGTVNLTSGASIDITFGSSVNVSGAANGILNGGTINMNSGDINVGDMFADGVNNGTAGTAGGKGGTINLKASGSLGLPFPISGHIDISANGADAVNSSNAGQNGFAGGTGGTINATAAALDFGQVFLSAFGGNGGQGGLGLNGGTKVGGNGGAGGAGGKGGNINVTVSGAGELSQILAYGGNGGAGSQGGTGGAPATANAFAGGKGGNGGAGGLGGNVTIKATDVATGSLSFSDDINANGGGGQAGGRGGDGGTGSSGGGKGGDGGAGGAMGQGGIIKIDSQNDITFLGKLGINASGGIGSFLDGGEGDDNTLVALNIGGLGGNGGAALTGLGGNGGNGGVGGGGAKGGTVSLISQNGDIANTLVSTTGKGVDFFANGADGGRGNNGGDGGNGSGPASGGSGGNGAAGGKGGAGGSVTVQALKGAITTQTVTPNSDWLWGAATGGYGGKGGVGGTGGGSDASAGNGGNGGAGGAAGDSGTSKFASKTANGEIFLYEYRYLDANSLYGALGGAGGAGGNAGSLNPNATGRGGNGGNGGVGGKGGKAGTMSMTTDGDMILAVDSDIFNAAGRGGDGGKGGNGSSAGSAAAGQAGGNGGNGGTGGAAGAGAPISAVSSNGKVGFTSTFGANAFGSGMQALGGYGGNGGDGGTAGQGVGAISGSKTFAGNGGNGGNGGNAGAIGNGGAVTISAKTDIGFDQLGFIYSGTDVPSTITLGGGKGADGGIATVFGNGGQGGSGGNGSSGGAGGAITLTAGGSIFLSTSAVSGQAGTVIQSYSKDASKGGDAGAGANAAGAAGTKGGNAGKAGNGGATLSSGNISLIAKSGLINTNFGAQGSATIVASNGFGGDAGAGNIGGNGSASGGNGSSSGTAGSGADNVSIIKLSAPGNISVGFIAATGGTGGVVSANGGGGGSASNGNGGNGGSGGKAGAGGKGGQIQITSTAGEIVLDSNNSHTIAATGGSAGAYGGNGGAGGSGSIAGNGIVAGNGGAGGAGATGSNGGQGGKIALTAFKELNKANVNDLVLVADAGGTGSPGSANGGAGGNGGMKGGAGGKAGVTGNGGAGGSITVKATDVRLVGAKASGASAFDGSGVGGKGGDYTGALASGLGGIGGFGGTAGNGGKGGQINITATTGGITTALGGGSGFTVIGGSGGGLPNGSGGGAGGRSNGAGTKGGDAGKVGAGAEGGKIVLAAGLGNAGIAIGLFDAQAYGGSAGASRAVGGRGGDSDRNNGGAGGAGAIPAAGGKGGSITISAQSGGITTRDLLMYGGDASNEVGGGGDGGTGNFLDIPSVITHGGAGGALLSGIIGAQGGSLKITAPNLKTAPAAGATLTGQVNVNGGAGSSYNLSAHAGRGGSDSSNNSTGGAGGNAGKLGGGGAAGSVTVSVPAAAVVASGVQVNARGGSGGSSSGGGTPGSGGYGSSFAGAPGSAAAGGAGGKGGTVSLTSLLNAAVINGQVNALGGSAGSGTAGADGALAGSTGTAGGVGGNGGIGGAGGSVSVIGTAASVNAGMGGKIDVRGGSAGGGGKGGNGANGIVAGGGGAGGNGGASGTGGQGGNVVVKATANSLVGLKVDDNTVNANGGSSFVGAPGGKGGAAGGPGGTDGPGGTGGAGGNGGKGGNITLGAVAGAPISIGTATPPTALGGNGAVGGTGGDGGGLATNGGDGGKGGNGGDGGTIKYPTGVPLPTATQVVGGGALGAGGAPGNGGSQGPDGVPGKLGKISLLDDEEDENSTEIAEADSANHVRAVAFVQPVLRLTEREVFAANAVVAPSAKDATIVSGNARIHVAAGASAFVVHDGEQLCVLALHERRAGDVSMLVDGHEVVLQAGQKVRVGGRDIMSEIAERNVRTSTTSGGTVVSVSDYSIPSALHHIAALRDAKYRGVYAQMLKDAAALQLLTASKGVYRVSRN